MLFKNYITCSNCLYFKLQQQFRNISKLNYQSNISPLEKLVEKHRKKIIYNTYLNKDNPNFNFWKRLAIKKQTKEVSLQIANTEPIPSCLKQLIKADIKIKAPVPQQIEQTSITNFPFGTETSTPIQSTNNFQDFIDTSDNVADMAHKEVTTRHQLYSTNHRNWMMDYENFDDDCDDEVDLDRWKINYGTPDPKVPISNVPCGGCGALLHCKDTSIPGYIPSEIYKNCFNNVGVDLKALVCQRCHFLQNYNLALQVRVSPDDYPKILEKIKEQKALIILIVDLFDFPCSIWPGIADILGENKSIVVVGNKVDLLPRDSMGYLNTIQNILKETVIDTIGKKAASRVKHVGLISAQTGWGVEELINKLHNIWKTAGNVYLVGCTNVGKSTLFNCLLQSDYCKVKAVDLVQRATTSQWPGTTLNLLKFPILRPSGWKLYVRTKRLQSLRRLEVAENRLRKIQLQTTRDQKYATLIGHLERTFQKDPLDKSNNMSIGLDDNLPEFKSSKWCYDTPGVVQPNQIIHLLTTEELTLTLPKETILAKTFSIRLGQTLFIGGLGRVDYIEGPYNIKFTVFCCNSLPITLCDTEHAETIYEEFLGTDVLLVPKGSTERLSKWPNLKASDLLKLVGRNELVSCGDIVLSNAGWISVTSDETCDLAFKAWTPEARGIYLRKSLLPFMVTVRGRKIHHTPLYEPRIFVPK